MPTTTVKVVDNTGASDYTSPQTWEDATPANLVTTDQIWEGQCKNQTFTGLLVLSGTTTDATRYQHLTTQAGASFNDHATVQTNTLRYNAAVGAAITSSSTYTYLIDSSSQNYFHMSNLQVAATSASAGTFTDGGGTTCFVDRCILEQKSTAGVKTGGAINNTLMIWRASATNGVVVSFGSAAITQCTIAATSAFTLTNGVQGNYGTATLTNCAILGCTNVKSGSVAFTFTNCASNAASPPSGVSSVTYSSSLVVQPLDALRDFRLVSGSALVDAGAVTAVGTDIAKTTRPQNGSYDIGCWEHVIVVTDVLLGQASL